ncbi:hypothetical protein KP509_23G049400 [Ceratopteris richardii]|uniref:Protein disulfide-isomerase SCO2 n=1 Tax=Ceratopteris richardii TaxID=49495 RepID=A0A8T2S2A5_CERRI|nr:hypothetical protein KP509_23G049400 [Ceratopteris richardii]
MHCSFASTATSDCFSIHRILSLSRVKSIHLPSSTGRQSTFVERDPLVDRDSNSIEPPNNSWNESIWGSPRNCKWHKEDESALSAFEPLPLPMTYPGSAPSLKDVMNMKNCDPEIKDCRDVIYQWTGECSRCQGTGKVIFYKEKDREVVCECINCIGLGLNLPECKSGPVCYFALFYTYYIAVVRLLKPPSLA